MTVARTICLGFLGTILVSTLLLTLPVSIANGTWGDPLVALFTATSATCVTGLAVVDTGTYFSVFGQAMLLLTIQIGGLGYMTATTFLVLLLGRRFRLRHRVAVQESLDAAGLTSVSQLVTSVIALTVIIELTGAFILMLQFVPEFGWSQGLWQAMFHSVSAFNNAGFSLFPDNLIGYSVSPIVVLTISLLIILGGIGYQTIMEVFLWGREALKSEGRPFCFSMHFKTVTSTTLFLLLVGFVGFYATEQYAPGTLAFRSQGDRLWLALFQSVTARTAGFNTIDIGAMSTAGLFLMIALMFVGASPGSTGGGIKTTTLRILANCTQTVLRGGDDVILYRRQVPKGLLMKAFAVVMGSLTTVILVVMAIAISDPTFSFVEILFEAVSAFGTVGLSMGITAQLSVLAKLIIITLMYIGRVGVLLLMEALLGEPQASEIDYPEEDLLVG
jgi:trk system potassium uptake protein TrkH